MHDDGPRGTNFWLGNALLGLALVILLSMGRLWEVMGVGAMALWVIVAGIGTWFLLHDDDKGGRK